MTYVKDQESGGPHPKSGGSHPTSDVEQNLGFADFSPLTTFSSRITICGSRILGKLLSQIAFRLREGFALTSLFNETETISFGAMDGFRFQEEIIPDAPHNTIQEAVMHLIGAKRLRRCCS